MQTIITIVIICAILGAIGALLACGRPKDVAAGATSGAFWSMGCMLRLVIFAILIAAGIWLVNLLLA